MAKVWQVMPLKAPETKDIRVAAYARVSSGKDAMLHSLSAQVSYFSDFIQKHPGWVFAGVYADEAKTGTKDNRPEFQRLLQDCRDGKIDMIITKAVSRFARNTVTLLETTRELKALGITVFFEKEGLYSNRGQGELVLSLLATVAEEESRTVSENCKWRIRNNFTEGKPWNGTMLGYRYVDGVLIVVPKEAEVVRLIFHLYLNGLGFAAIMKRLNQQEMNTRFDKAWCRSGVKRVLNNYAYTGNLLLQQTYTENHITKRRMVNEGQLPKYHAANSHEAIITPEQFAEVQEEMARRATRHCQQHNKKNTYPFTGLITCAKCGKRFNRKSRPGGPVWICSTYNTQGKAACSSKQIPEAALMAAALEALGCPDPLPGDLTAISAQDDNTLVFALKDGRRILKRWIDRSRAESWTADMREAARQANYKKREKK